MTTYLLYNSHPNTYFTPQKRISHRKATLPLKSRINLYSEPLKSLFYMFIPVNKETLQAHVSPWNMLQCSPQKERSRTAIKKVI